MIRVKKPLVAMAITGLSLALVAACSSSGKPSSTTGGSSNSSSTAQVAPPSAKTDNSVNDLDPTPRADVKDGGTMSWGISGPIANFNYYEVDGGTVDNFNIYQSYLPTAFHFSAAGVPSVDTDYFTSITKTSSNPQVIDYKINPKAKWSDGSAISWEDMADLWKASNGTNTAYNISGSNGWSQISSVKMGANAQEAIVTYSKPFTDWQSLYEPLVPKSLTATPAAFNKGWINKPLVTAGPFKWGSSNKTAQTYTVVRDPKWWGDPAKLDSITFVVYADTGAAVQAMGTKGLDYEDITVGDEVANVKAAKSYSNVAVRSAGGNVYRQFTLNTKSPLLTDEKVRQAVVLGINRQAITKALIGPLGGNPTPLQNHFFMKNQAAYTETCGQYCNYNAPAAIKLLTDDGWTKSGDYFTKGGKTLSLAITIPTETPNSLLEAQISQATLKAVGIKLTITQVPSADFFAKYITPGKFDITTFTWQGTQFPVGGALSIFKYDPKNVGQNYGQGGNAAINTLIENASTATSTDEENKIANQASTTMWANAAWLPLYQKPTEVAVNKDLVNIGAVGFADLHYQDIGYKK